MKLVTFVSKKNDLRIGVVSNEKVIDIQEGEMAHHGAEDPSFVEMQSFIQGMPKTQEKAQRIVETIIDRGPESAIYSLKGLELKAPLPRPVSIRDCMVFAGHLANAMHTIAGWRFPPAKWINGTWRAMFGKNLFRPPGLWYKIPAYYKGNPMMVVGPDADIRWPSYTKMLDYELEFGIYISRQGRDIPVEKANDYIAGYTIFNDVSARDIQMKEMKLRLGPAKGKDFDTSNVMGPYFVTGDEVGDPYNLEMTARVNGEEWSRGNSRDMNYSFEDIISYISKDETLYPGEFLGSGTVPTGCGLELDRWIKPGDVIELEVEKLGVLSNRFVKP